MFTYKEQEELQFLGFFGIFKESLKIIFSWRKIFTQITLSLIIPSSAVSFTHTRVSKLLYYDILSYKYKLAHTEKNTSTYAKFVAIISSKSTAFKLSEAIFQASILILSLLSTSAVAYTIACIYAAKEITLTKIITVSPKVWKTLIITAIRSFSVILVYLSVGGASVFMWVDFFGYDHKIPRIIFLILVILYVIGFVYIAFVYHLACVVSMLEDFGYRAVIKSRAFMNSKIMAFVGFSILQQFCSLGTGYVFDNFVVPTDMINNKVLSTFLSTWVGILCVLFVFMLDLFRYVVYTVIYFFCKSYHHENIDKNSLGEHLDGLLGKYVPPTPKNVPIGRIYYEI